ncbi:hypothetical protein L0F63_005853 [Massospora cicadina]|nr:hypothetical protein L0F63_005853 [Massospora cicadina]
MSALEGEGRRYRFDELEDLYSHYEGGYVDISDEDNILNEQSTNCASESLNLDECEEKVWLLKVCPHIFGPLFVLAINSRDKVPAFLADKWEQAMEEGADLGKKIRGTVVRDLKANPFPTDPEYRSIIRKRALEAGEKRSGIVINSQDVQLENLKYNQDNPPVWTGLGKRAKLDANNKAPRLSEKDLMDLLFKMFTEHKFWLLKDLQKRTQQPMNHLKNILKNIAILNRKGKHHTLYQLKDEYTHSNKLERVVDANGPRTKSCNKLAVSYRVPAVTDSVTKAGVFNQNWNDVDDFFSDA